MHNAVIAAAAVALVVIILFARLRIGFSIVVACAVLLPGTLPIHNPVTPHALFTRVLLVVLALRLVFAIHAGVVSVSTLRWTTLHTAFVVFLGAVFLAGVVFADATVRPGAATTAALLLLDQFFFFAVMLACVRAIGDLRWVLGVVAVVLLMSAGIGIVEHVTERSWGHFIYGRSIPGITASNELTLRVTDVRVKAGAEYSLQFGWVTAMLLPALLAWLASARVGWRRWLPITVAGVGVVLLAEYWSFTRTSLAAFAVVALITAVAARNRRLLLFTGSSLAICVVLFAFVTRLQQGFVGLPTGPIDVRSERLPLILQIGLYHPLRGIGLGGLTSIGVPNTDSTYLQLYGDAGIIGIVTGLALVITAGCCCLAGLRSTDRVDRLAAAVGVAGTLAMLAGGIAYDALRSLSSTRPFWLLIAIGVVATERVTGPLPALIRPRRAVAFGAVVAAGLIGVVAYALTPVHYAEQYQFQTVSTLRQVLPSNPETMGSTFADTVCIIAERVTDRHPGAQVDCATPGQAPGVGTIRVQASSADGVRRVVVDIQNAIQTGALSGFSLTVRTPMRSGRDTALAWAPFWLPLSVLLAVFLLPIRGKWPWRKREKQGTMWGEIGQSPATA